MQNLRKFNIYILLSSFSKSLIEVFVPIILYKAGFRIEEIIFYSLLKFSFILFLNPVICLIGKIIKFNWLNIFAIIFFYIGYYYLFNIEHNITSLFFLALFLVLYEHSYWVARHYLALKILDKEKIASEVGGFLIMTQIALIPSSFIGALLIKNLDIKLLLLIISSLLIVSSLIIFRIKIYDKNKNKNNINEITKVIKNMPKRSIIFLMIEQFRMIGSFLFVLYLYKYVSENLTYIGVFNIVVGVASIIFVYFFSKKMDKSKKDYLIVSSLFVTIIWILKLNITSSLLMIIIALFQGLSERMYEVSNSRNMYSLGKHYDSMIYIMITESIYNIARIIICLIGFVFIKDLKLFLYLCGIMIFVAGLIGFDDKEKNI